MPTIGRHISSRFVMLCHVALVPSHKAITWLLIVFDRHVMPSVAHKHSRDALPPCCCWRIHYVAVVGASVTCLHSSRLGYVCVYAYVCEYVYVYVYIYAYAYTHTHTHIHTHTHTHTLRNEYLSSQPERCNFQLSPHVPECMHGPKRSARLRFNLSDSWPWGNAMLS